MDKKNFIYICLFVILFLILFVLININFIFSQTTSTTANTFNYGYNTYPNTNYPYTNPNNYNYPADYNYNQNYYNNYYNQNGYTYNPNYGGYNYFGGGYNPTSGNYYGSYDYYSYTNPSVFWPNYNTDTCNGIQNVVLQIAPGGCSPGVVRSDLLEDQNVPVFCKLMSINANPLINVMRIRSVSFQGQYPKGISWISYFSSRSAITRRAGYDSLMTSPINSDLGYMVIVLARQTNENNMSDFIEGNITANIDFDSEGSYGVGQTTMYASPMTDADWLSKYTDYSFWSGRAYVRADSVEKDRATISVYRDFNSRQSSVTLKEGETSKDIYLNGFYCGAGLNIRVDKIDVPVESALLQINDQQMWVSSGDKIIDNKCTVTGLSSSGFGGKISISCPVQNGKIDLSLGAPLNSSDSVVPLQEGSGFEYYSKAISTYTDLYNLYPNDYRVSGEDPYAAVGLYEGAELSKKFGMTDKAIEFYDKLKKNYPDSRIASLAEREENLNISFQCCKDSSLSTVIDCLMITLKT